MTCWWLWIKIEDNEIQLWLGNAIVSHMTPALMNSLVARKASSFHTLICSSAKHTCPGWSSFMSLSLAHSFTFLRKKSWVQFISFGIKTCSSDNQSYQAFALNQFTQYTVGLFKLNSCRWKWLDLTLFHVCWTWRIISHGHSLEPWQCSISLAVSIAVIYRSQCPCIFFSYWLVYIPSVSWSIKLIESPLRLIVCPQCTFHFAIGCMDCSVSPSLRFLWLLQANSPTVKEWLVTDGLP